MSLYEQQHKYLVEKHNNEIIRNEKYLEYKKKEVEKQIELLQKLKEKQLPAENPIISKILPQLPYEINKIILDKLNIQKKNTSIRKLY